MMSQELHDDLSAFRSPYGAAEASHLEPSVKLAIESAVTSSVGSMTDNLTQVIEIRLTSFTCTFSEENGATVEQAIKKARRENYSCKRKGSKQQLDHKLQVFDKFDGASIHSRATLWIK